MIKFRVHGKKGGYGECSYSFNRPNLSKEKAVEVAIDGEQRGFDCVIMKDEDHSN
jgi:hypothetical protein